MQLMNMTTYSAHDQHHARLGDAGSLEGAVTLIADAAGVPRGELTFLPCRPAEGTDWPTGYRAWNVYRAADLAAETPDDGAMLIGVIRSTDAPVTIG